MKRKGILIMVAAVLLLSAGCGSEGEEVDVSEVISDSIVTKIPMKYSHVFLIRGSGGYVMVDAATEGSLPEIESALTGLGISPDEIGLIILTHGHKDHYGGLKAVKELTGAEVLCHENAASYIRKAESEPVVAQNFLGRLLNRLPELPSPAVEPDIVIRNETDLAPWGVPGRIISTPGHSIGSVSILLETGEALVGDTVRGESGKISLGMFYEEEEQLWKDIAAVTAAEPKVVYFSHGGIIRGEELAAFLENRTVRQGL